MDFESNFWEDDQHGLISRFENMLKEERVEYFDVNEFVDIIDYYLDYLQNLINLLILDCYLFFSFFMLIFRAVHQLHDVKIITWKQKKVFNGG